MKNWTKAQEQAINEFLMACMDNTYRCAHCSLRHEDGTCLFAADCFLNDGSHYHEDEDNWDIPDDVDESSYDPYCGCDMFEICGSIDEEW